MTLPRLKAAGADLSRLLIGAVCDLSRNVAPLDEAVKALEAFPSLLVLSPLRSFFGPESYVETVVRARLAPLLAWLRRTMSPSLVCRIHQAADEILAVRGPGETLPELDCSRRRPRTMRAFA